MAAAPTIYALVDPRTHEIFYVGKTTDLADRRGWHLKDDRDCPRVRKIQTLLNDGLAPLIVRLEECHPYRCWPEREKWWIAHGRQVGWPLTNQSEGGEASQYNNHGTRGKRPQGPKGPARRPGRPGK